MAVLKQAAQFWHDLNDFDMYRNGSDDHGLHENYRYKYALSFEKVDYPKEFTLFLQRNWVHTLTISVAYFAAIKVLQSWMASRTAFVLKYPLFLWNFALAVFSIAGFLRMSEDVFASILSRPFTETVCYSCHPNDVAAFWSLLFAISKVVELGDTLFVVLRKKPLIFLHYYHHAAVLIYTVHSGAEHTAAGRVFIVMNYFAHSCMYTYYAVSALGYRFPKIVSMTVTTVQTVQMLAGVGVSYLVYKIRTESNMPCQQSMANLYLAFTIYITFAILFIQFFINAYVRVGKKAIKEKKTN